MTPEEQMQAIRETLQRLTEKQEALGESLQLLTADVHEGQHDSINLRDACFALLSAVGNHERRIQKLEKKRGG